MFSRRFFLHSAAASVLAPRAFGSDNSLSLDGVWSFHEDPEGAGSNVRLPGSTDENRIGKPFNREPDFNGLTRNYEYVGPAWYERTVTVPPEWRGRRITLSLERCHWETRVWLDGKAAGMRDSLCVPHEYDLSGLAPGEHRLRVQVDNRLKYNMGKDAHSTSEQTQSNWNGIVGRMELRSSPPVWIDSVQIYPEVSRGAARVRVRVGNITGAKQRASVSLSTGAVSRVVEVEVGAEPALVETELHFPGAPALWDEFSPQLHELSVAVGAGKWRDTRTTTFGMREFAVSGKRFTLNGRTIYLRGTLECCIFPKTGYPPTDANAWSRIFDIARSYGLNHMRFHSWCPPEAAFAAADRLGMLLHVEAPQWAFDVGKDAPRDAFIREELDRILDTYGNHPSFVMMVMGNELSGDFDFLESLVKHGRDKDPRRLFSCSTARRLMPADQFHVTHQTAGGAVRGLRGGVSTDVDFAAETAASPVPVVSHEIAQWAVYPNLDEIAKYTGVLRARNFERVRADLEAKGLLPRARDFMLASGRLSALLYKEEIEVLLRTPGHAGFQLLDLHDFPGQGTALVGILDAFWDSKGLIEPSRFRRFCNSTVPLARLATRMVTSDQQLEAKLLVAHFGTRRLSGVRPRWSLVDARGGEVAGAALPPATLETGAVTEVGSISVPMRALASPAQLRLRLGLDGTPFENDWDVWLYPAAALPAAGDVHVARTWNDETRAALAEGKKVLLLAGEPALQRSLPGRFATVFWSPIWFKKGAQTMGILCDPAHAALAGFPTDPHGNWQWQDLLERSRTMIVDDLPASLTPVVAVIDNFSRNHRLANLLEARVGAGRLLICSLDLETGLDQRPAARQLLRSLLEYMQSPSFAPGSTLTAGQLSAVLKG